jgi:hypothetical protein
MLGAAKRHTTGTFARVAASEYAPTVMICAPAVKRQAVRMGVRAAEQPGSAARTVQMITPPKGANSESVFAQSPRGAAASGGRYGRQGWRRLTISTQQLFPKAFAVEATERHNFAVDGRSTRGATSG